MCGIFGIVVPENYAISANAVKKTLKALFLLSESRGKEAAGFAIYSGDNVYMLKRPLSASRLLKSSDYKKVTDKAIMEDKKGSCSGMTILGHSRMVTNGSQESHDNNQPIARNGAIAIHNGIVVNADKLWSDYPAMTRKLDVDSEVILELFNLFLTENDSLCGSFAKTYAEIEGYASVALMLPEGDHLLLGTNNGSMYVVRQEGLLVFCSEELMLKKLITGSCLRNRFKNSAIEHVEPGNGYAVNTKTGEAAPFQFKDEQLPEMRESRAGQEICDKGIRKKITIIDEKRGDHRRLEEPLQEGVSVVTPTAFIREFEGFRKNMEWLKRCTRCILPETMPFIEFDEKGVCNYCRNYKKKEMLSEDLLAEILERQRRQDSRRDCVVMTSGGRDSSYMLYYVREVLKMNPVAYTYDWGMVTDLARRNISRLCGKLGVEHLLISADINKKRKYIRQNVTAWLKKPHIGMIPLFMAGDKIFFHFAHKVKRDLGVELIFSGRNSLENTVFKNGFSGVRENYKTKPYDFSIFSKLKVAAFYAGHFLGNPSYWNGSLLDSVMGYFSAYFLPHDYVFFYDYIPWDEQVIIGTLKDYFDWEVASDTDSTWRIGDGTASFYNYIYYTVAGMSEIDTFQSNKIREGLATREEALGISRTFNQPRFQSIKWYCDTIGIDYEDAVTAINGMRKLYEPSRRL